MKYSISIFFILFEFYARAMTELGNVDKIDTNGIPKVWGAETNGLVCALKVSKQEFNINEQISLELFFKNVSARAFFLINPYDLRGEPWIWTLTITGEKGPIPYKSISSVVYTLTMKKINPGQILEYRGILDRKGWIITDKGRYKLKIKYQFDKLPAGDERQVWSGTIYSNEVEINLK